MRHLPWVAAALTGLVVACTPGAEDPPPPSAPSPTAVTATPSPSLDGGSTFVPSVPTAPAPTTAGGLTDQHLPVPSGWEPEVREGSLDEGFLGNGTWVHAREAQFSAIGVMTVGCAAVDDSSWEPPTAALEGNLIRDGQPGVVLALEFPSADAARGFFDGFVQQLEACEASGSVTRVGADADTWLGRRDLGSAWSEIVGLDGERVTSLIVSDGGAMPADQMRTLRDEMG